MNLNLSWLPWRCKADSDIETEPEAVKSLRHAQEMLRILSTTHRVFRQDIKEYKNGGAKKIVDTIIELQREAHDIGKYND